MAEKRIDTGVYQTYNAKGKIIGWRIYVRVNGKLRPKRLPATMSLGEVNAWRKDYRTDLRRAPELPPGAPGTLTDDARRYLDAVKTMPTYAERERHILEWVGVLGPNRRRVEITSVEIQAQRERWLLRGPRRVQRRVDGARQWVTVDEPLSPQSVTLRLRALSNLWTVLDGRRAPNPVRDVAEPEPRAEEARAVPADVLDDILAAAPDRYASGQNAIAARSRNGRRLAGAGATRSTDGISRTKIRARCMRWTGLAPVELARVQRHHIDLTRPGVWIGARGKGRRKKGAAKTGRWVPLVAEAVAAFQDLIATESLGPFSTSSFHASWQRWCARAGYDGLGLRPYDVRHSVGTDVYAATGDLTAVGELFGHSTDRITKRYARAALNPRVVAALAKMREKVTLEVTEKRAKAAGSSR